MSKKRPWFAPQGAGSRPKRDPKVLLSQCMIVKNEEKNIERALTWAKKIVCEQIVVDTGSADRTVEIAERMGAKVFHFEWINDFSAAKNFALSKAKGDWVAFLDADEYFNEADTAMLLKIIRRIHPTAGLTSLLTPLANLNDAGNVGSVLIQERVFRNRAFQYLGAIHEYLSPTREGCMYQPCSTNDITILHTGYTSAMYTGTDKLARNVELLRRELEGRPGDPNFMAYLADSLMARDELEEAKRLYTESLLGDKPMNPGLKVSAFPNFLRLCHDTDPELYGRAAERAVGEFPGIGTFNLHYGLFLCSKEEYGKAWDYLRKAEEFLKSDQVMHTQYLVGQTLDLFGHLAVCAEERGDEQAAVKYSVLTLRQSKGQLGVLGPLIGRLKRSGAGDDEILDLLGKIYDLKDPRDVITAAKGADAAGAEALMDRLKALAVALVDEIAEGREAPACAQ